MHVFCRLMALAAHRQQSRGHTTVTWSNSEVQRSMIIEVLTTTHKADVSPRVDMHAFCRWPALRAHRQQHRGNTTVTLSNSEVQWIMIIEVPTKTNEAYLSPRSAWTVHACAAGVASSENSFLPALPSWAAAMLLCRAGVRHMLVQTEWAKEVAVPGVSAAA